MICMYTFFLFRMTHLKKTNFILELHCLCRPHVWVGQIYDRDGEKLASPRETRISLKGPVQATRVSFCDLILLPGKVECRYVGVGDGGAPRQSRYSSWSRSHQAGTQSELSL